MVKPHLSDEQVQELAMGSTTLPQEVVAHAESCVHCKERLESYWLMISTIEGQKAPAFDFDLAAAVVAQIETPVVKPNTSVLWWLFAVTLAGILIGVSIYFGEYMQTVFEGLKSMAIYLVTVSGIVLGIFLAIDQHKTYQKKMKMLDLS